MRDSFTESRIESLRDDVRALQGKLDAHIREAEEERRKREHAKDIRLMVLIGILWVLDIVSFLMPID